MLYVIMIFVTGRSPVFYKGDGRGKEDWEHEEATENRVPHVFDSKIAAEQFVDNLPHRVAKTLAVIEFMRSPAKP